MTTEYESKKTKQKTHRQRIATVLKTIGYTVMWLIVWSCIAVALVIPMVIAGVAMFPKASDDIAYVSNQDINSMIIIIVLLLAGIFFGFIWLLRNKQGLSYKVSRRVLLVCTIIGLLFCIPMSLFDRWIAEDSTLQDQTEKSKSEKRAKRYQYMLCKDGSYQSYSDKDMKNASVGFVKGGEDYCKTNGESKMLRLTNSLDEAKKNAQRQSVTQRQSASATYQPSSKTTSSVEDCGSVDIPYKTVREEVNWLYAGEERVIPGYAGLKQVCRDASGKVTSTHKYYDPTNEIVYFGTKALEKYSSSSPNKCDGLTAQGLANSTYYYDCARQQ